MQAFCAARLGTASYGGMATPGKGKALLSTTVPKEWGSIIADRAAPLRMSQAAFLAAIVEKWVEAGCPPVTEADRAMQHLRELEKTLPGNGANKRSA